VISRFVLPTLLGLLAVLIVTFAVLMAAHSLAVGLGDTDGAGHLWWAAMASLVLLVIDCLLLLGTLGYLQVVGPSQPIDRWRKDTSEEPDAPRQ
jgi:hypothetical protein